MRFMLPLAALLIGAAPASVPMGRFQTWLSSEKVPIAITSDGVAVHVEALPCPARPVGDSSCRWGGYNNQALVTVRAPGLAPVSVTTDPQASHARIAVVRFGRADPRPGVIIESQSGGSGGDLTVQLLVPVGAGYRVLPLTRSDGGRIQGEIADGPRDVSGDGRIDLILHDGAFANVFGCNACTPRPPRVFAVKQGRVVDESRDPTLRSVFADDMARLEPLCLSKQDYRNGACAAYVADAARAGRFVSAWTRMLTHYEHGRDIWEPCDLPASAWTGHGCPAGHVILYRSFPESLRAFLTKAGYLPV